VIEIVGFLNIVELMLANGHYSKISHPILQSIMIVKITNKTVNIVITHVVDLGCSC